MWQAALPFIKMGMGALSGIFGGGRSKEEQWALKQQMAQQERANQFFQQARGQMGKVTGWAAPILGGSRTAAAEALSPEIQGASQRIDASRRSLINLTPRSGGAAAMLDPYAKATAATDIMLKARPMAAGVMQDAAKTTGGWGSANLGAAGSILDNERWRRQQEAERGAGFFNILNRGIDQFGDWLGSRKPKDVRAAGKSTGPTPPSPFGNGGLMSGQDPNNPLIWHLK